MRVNPCTLFFTVLLIVWIVNACGTVESQAANKIDAAAIAVTTERIPAALATLWSRKGGTLSIDPQGWTNNPAIAAGPNGTFFIAWLQHRNPAIWEYSGVRVKQWTGKDWLDLGGRIGHEKVEPIRWPSAYDPSLAVVGGVVYLAWYEGGGYGWSTSRRAQVFVSHWNGTAWIADPDAADPDHGALSSSWGGRNPRLENVDGVLHAAWVAASTEKMQGNVVSVKRLDGLAWSPVGTLQSANGGLGIIIDVETASIGSTLYVGWTEYARSYSNGNPQTLPSKLYVARLDGDSFSQVGGPLNVSDKGFANYLSMAVQDDTLHVAWQEKSADGAYQIYAKRLNGENWTDGTDSLNRIPISAEAGRPALGASDSNVWMAWSEGVVGEKSQLYVRSWDGQSWSEPSASLNMADDEGSADSPDLAVANGVPNVVWVEKHFPSSSKQLYVAGGDDKGREIPVSLRRYGADQPTPKLKPNTWTVLNAGGIVAGAKGVGDEGYSSINYVAAIRRTVLFGKYHATEINWGEDQNALLGYDFSRNRWDVIEITENSWSEHLPGVGHDEGNVAVDSVRGIYFTAGNLTLNGATSYKAYAYDLLAGRGKRLLPAVGSDGAKEVTGAFDPVNRVAFMRGRLYDFATNAWTPVANCATRGWAGVAYDEFNGVFVQFGGASFNGEIDGTTWILDPMERRCEKRNPTRSPPGGYSHLAFNKKHGVIMMLSGNPLQLWSYSVTANRWKRLADPPADFPQNAGGQKLTYDSDADVLLYHNGSNLSELRAYRYVPDESAL